MRFNYRQAGCAVLIAATLGGVSACGFDDSASAKGGNTLAYLQVLAADPSVQSVTLGMKCAAKEAGHKLLVFDAGFDQGKQVTQFQTAMTQGADGIVSHAVNTPGMYPSYAKAKGAKVPVIDYAGSSEHPKNATYVGEDPAAVAQTTVDALLKKLPTGGKAVLIGGPPGVAGVKPRADEFKKAAAAAGIEILGEEDSLTLTPDDIQKKAASLLLKHPEANIIWGVTGATAATGGQVAKQQGRHIGKELFTVGAGASPDVANFVRTGVLTHMIDNLSYEWGEAMVGLLDKAIDGEKITNPTFEYKAYTKDNIDTWVAPADRCSQ